MEISVGTSLIHIMDYIENNHILPEFKTKILDYCRAELQIGDGKISNEIELAILQAWLNETDDIKIPAIEKSCNLIDVYSFQDGQNLKVFEEYQSRDGSYYIKITTQDPDENILNTKLVHRSKSLKEILENGGTEDILIDSNGNNIAESRLVQKTTFSESGRKNLNLYSDINLDGKFD